MKRLTHRMLAKDYVFTPLPSLQIQIRSNCRPLQWIAVTVIIALLSGSCVGANDASSIRNSSSVVRDFTFSSDPSVEILSVTFRGGLLHNHPSYRIYGDGRIEIFIPDTRQDSGSYTRTLTFEEMREVMRFAVDHHLAESSREDVEGKISMKYAGNTMPHATDGYDMIFSIHLTTFVRDGVELGPKDNTIIMHYPSFLLRVSPDTEEIQGLVGIQRRLLDLRHMEENEDIP